MESKLVFTLFLFGVLQSGTSYVVPRAISDAIRNADYFVIRGNFGYTAYAWFDNLLHLDQLTSVVTSDIIKNSQAAQDRARQALSQYSQSVQQAWEQLQRAGQDTLAQRMNSFDLTNTATNLYYSLQPADRTMFENLFLQVYSYPFSRIVGRSTASNSTAPNFWDPTYGTIPNYPTSKNGQ